MSSIVFYRDMRACAKPRRARPAVSAAAPPAVHHVQASCQSLSVQARQPRPSDTKRDVHRSRSTLANPGLPTPSLMCIALGRRSSAQAFRRQARCPSRAVDAPQPRPSDAKRDVHRSRSKLASPGLPTLSLMCIALGPTRRSPAQAFRRQA